MRGRDPRDRLLKRARKLRWLRNKRRLRNRARPLPMPTPRARRWLKHRRKRFVMPPGVRAVPHVVRGRRAKMLRAKRLLRARMRRR